MKTQTRVFRQFNGTFQSTKTRIGKLHNTITLQETNYKRNSQRKLGECLTRFFPNQYIDYLVKTFSETDKSLYSEEKNLYLYLSALTLIYTHHDIHLPDSTLQELNVLFDVKINRDTFTRYFRYIQSEFPNFWKEHPKNRHREFVNCVKYLIPHIQRNGESKAEIINSHNKIMEITHYFLTTSKFKHLKPKSYEHNAMALINLVLNTVDVFNLPTQVKSSVSVKKHHLWKTLGGKI